MTIIDDIEYGTLSDAIILACRAIDERRDRVLYDKFAWNNAQWDCDPVARANISGTCAFLAGSGDQTPSGFVWRDYNNNNWPMTSAQMFEMGNSLISFVFQCYQVSWQHKSNVQAITDETQILSVINYDYTTGWPDVSISFSITNSTSGENGTFILSGDQANVFSIGIVFFVTGSTSNDGTYSVLSSAYDSTAETTTITVNESVNAIASDGSAKVP